MAPSRPVSLARNPIFACGIPYSAGHFYRIIGWSGFADLLACGHLRAAPGGRHAKAYFEKGYANATYARKGAGDVVVEVAPTTKIIDAAQDCYPWADPANLVTLTDRIGVWVHVPTGSHQILIDGF